MSVPSVLVWSSIVALALLLIGIVCAFARMVRGPTAADRVVALDMVSMLLVSFAGVAAVAFNDAAFLDVAITLALVTFLATVAFARYITRQQLRQDQAAAGGASSDRKR